MQVLAVSRGCWLCSTEDHDASIVATAYPGCARRARPSPAAHGAARTSAETSTPAAGASDATLILIEHADLVSEIDLGEPGHR